MYFVGQKVTHPMHGAGIIEEIVARREDGKERNFYTLKLCLGSLVLMLPCENCEHIGLRPVISSEEAHDFIEHLDQIEPQAVVNWNQRYRENMDRIKSGDLLQVATVIRTLRTREHHRGLSTGERKMLSAARKILISELMLAMDESYDTIEHMIDQKLA
ncbi:CarD family transcriptional regulator [Acidaminobacterium chupaoyuni]